MMQKFEKVIKYNCRCFFLFYLVFILIHYLCWQFLMPEKVETVCITLVNKILNLTDSFLVK